ncbi:MAG: zinc ribbon domain-containing protein [Acidobacteriia bacterium]|nr:zinc ribbon domain-containing protein [Terriglobia bacterium]
MPLYEYECKKCHHRFERIQKFSDPHVKKCPECGGPIEQVISAPAVQFKGSGWYVTDYGKNTSHTPMAKESKEGDASSVKKDEKPKGEEKSRSEEKNKPEASKKKSEKK